jgi:hypothetical protein
LLDNQEATGCVTLRRPLRLHISPSNSVPLQAAAQ